MFSIKEKVFSLFWLFGLLVPLTIMGAAGETKGQELNPFNITMGLLGGLALFLYGMELMSDGLKKAAGEKMKLILAALSKNRFLGVLTGTVTTAIIQSSSVTTVLLVGFVSAGLMSLSQSVSIIFGANIGTTITAQIIAFKVTKYALLMIAVGFGMLFFSKKESIRQYGGILLGLGLVFYGMSVMSGTMKPLRTNEDFINLMANMSNPLLGILTAALFTALVQSSSATTGVVIVLAMQGIITPGSGNCPLSWCEHWYLHHCWSCFDRKTEGSSAGGNGPCVFQYGRGDLDFTFHQSLCGLGEILFSCR